MRDTKRLAALLIVMAVAAAVAQVDVKPPAIASGKYFQIRVVDEQTGRGVPLVELRTSNSIRYYTDSAGLIAFFEPGLMDQKVFFTVASHGYEFPKDQFGYAGLILQTTPGTTAEIKIKRVNIAERLYRITGEGIYNDSVLSRQPVPIRKPLLNAQVVGQDSALAVVYNGRIRWFWGDTSRACYPLGNFHTAGATSELPGRGGLDPAVGVDLNYFVDSEGFSRAMCPLDGNKPLVWIDGVMAVPDKPDKTGRQRLLCHYNGRINLDKVLETGIALYNDEKDIFEKVKQLDLKEPWRYPHGHPILVKDKGQEYCVFACPHPLVRVKADLEHVLDPNSYEAFTPLVAGTKYDKQASRLERDKDGQIVWGWKPNTDPVNQSQEKELIQAGLMNKDEARYQLADVQTGKGVLIHGGSFYWNEFRRKYIMIAAELFGTSLVGEIWFAEADEPTGPWLWARKVVTHDRYSFYNPTQHPFFDQQGGRFIYFEGTYTATFSGNDSPTPRYDYNQMMYRLDLADPRLAAPLRLDPNVKPEPQTAPATQPLPK